MINCTHIICENCGLKIISIYQNFGWFILTDVCTWLIMLTKVPLFYYLYRLVFPIVKLFILFLSKGI